MAHIKRKFIDKHWLIFVLRGAISLGFGLFALGGKIKDIPLAISFVAVFLLVMGIIDSSSALYNSAKKRDWINSVVDALIDVVAAIALLFIMDKNILYTLIAISIYTIASGIIDIIHGFISTEDKTDRFIRIVAGICGAVMGFVILNAGDFEMSTFIRFFGAYIAIVGVCSLIYGVHNRDQEIEDRIARKETAKKAAATRRANKKAALAAKTTSKKSSKKSK